MRQAPAANYRRGPRKSGAPRCVSWNGRFFTHFIDEDPTVKRNLGVDEKTRSRKATPTPHRGIGREHSEAIIKTYLDLKQHLPPGSPVNGIRSTPLRPGFGRTTRSGNT